MPRRGPSFVVLAGLALVSIVVSRASWNAMPGAGASAPASPSSAHGGEHARASSQRPSAWRKLPDEARLGLEVAMAANDARYEPTVGESGLELRSEAAGVARFDATGARIDLGAHALTLRGVAIDRRQGRGRVRSATLGAGRAPRVEGAEVRTDRGHGVTETWRALPSGLEHGIVLGARPEGTGELVVELEFGGDLVLGDTTGGSVVLRDASGRAVASYAHLAVFDATGARMRATMEVDGSHVAIVIDDSTARYPMVVDPVLAIAEQAMLVSLKNSASDFFGADVAVSADGTRAIVGVGSDDTPLGLDSGTARVFVRVGETWAEEALLQAADGAANDGFGGSVAIDADGTRVLVGVPSDDTAAGGGAGSARVFVRSGTSWMAEATLTAFGAAANDSFGVSVALAADASRAVVGVLSDDTPGGADVGSARVFTRNGSTWTEETTLLAVDAVTFDMFGGHVSITSDGSRILVGAEGCDTLRGEDTGCAFVFSRNVTAWSVEATLEAADGDAFDAFASDVAIAGDGSRLVVGVEQDDSGANTDDGSARVFRRSGTTWSPETTLLAPDGTDFDNFGSAVAISSDGSRVAVGARRDDTVRGGDAGSARVFVRTGSTWSEEAPLSAPDGAAGDRLGVSVAMDDGGSAVLAGVMLDDSGVYGDVGTVRIFRRSQTSWSQEATLVNSGGANDELFGSAVAVNSDGSRAVVGVEWEDTVTGVDAGTARVLVRVGGVWTEEAVLVPASPTAYAYFGGAVAMTPDGTRIVVGSTNASTASVFVRTGSTWAAEGALSVTDVVTSVALSADGSRAIVGARRAGATNAGQATVFARAGSTWLSEFVLFASDGAYNEYFGNAVVLDADGNRAFVGAPFDDTPGGSGAGSVRVFTRAGAAWTEGPTVLAASGGGGDQFGTSLALSSDETRLLVGAPYDDVGGVTNCGSARGFAVSGTALTEDEVLLAGDRSTNDQLGSSVSVSSDGSVALVVAGYDDTASGSNSGTTRVFVRSAGTSTEVSTLSAAGSVINDGPGSSVALSSDGSHAILGIPSDDTFGGVDADSARVFSFRPADTDGTSCLHGSTCLTGECVDGVCCDTACGAGDPNDCMACTTALTGAPSGTCAPLSASVAPTIACRPSAGPCDVAEVCSNASTACPATDAVEPATTLCRAMSSLPTETCDAPEYCTGTGVLCPADAAATSSTVCRPAAGNCDLEEVCNGSSKACPGDAKVASGSPCRTVAGGCDVEETCDGSSTTCPADAFRGAGYTCRVASGTCDVAETCVGGSAACPTNVYVTDGTSCDDGLTCTQASACQLGACAASVMLDCTDGVACTTDSCTEPGGCTHTPIAACLLDGGSDAASGQDAGATTTLPSTGCSCRVAGRSSSTLSIFAAGMLGLAIVARRRRRGAR